MTRRAFFGTINKLLTVALSLPRLSAAIWRRSLVGYSGRFIPGRSLVRIWPPLPDNTRSNPIYIVGFKPTYIRPLGQAVKTSPFHGGNMGSNPVGVTNTRRVCSWVQEQTRFSISMPDIEVFSRTSTFISEPKFSGVKIDFPDYSHSYNYRCRNSDHCFIL